MTDSDVQEWSELALFDDGEVAHDITTAVLAMEYEASLIDLSDESIVAGFGSDLDPDSPQAQGPFVLAPKGRVPRGGALSFRGVGSSQYETTESESESLKRRTTGGPWSLRVPASASDELSEILDTLLDERHAFESQIQNQRDIGLRARQLTFGVFLLIAFICLCIYLVVQIFF